MMHIDNEEEDRSDRVGTYRGTRAARWLLEMQYLESDGSNLEIYQIQYSICGKTRKEEVCHVFLMYF